MSQNLEVMNIDGIECYEKDGVVFLNLETCARGLGFTRIADSGNEVVRWERVEKHLAELGVPTCGHDDYIPENIFYRLAMKAKNATAEAFQAKIADEVIPSIRKHGAYIEKNTLDKMIASPEFGIKLLTALKEEQEKSARLKEENEILLPQAQYFQELVDRKALTNIQTTAKEFHMKQSDFTDFLEQNKLMFRTKKDGYLMPYNQHVQAGWFEIKDWKSPYNKKTGQQAFITAKGKQVIRMLLEKDVSFTNV